MTSMIEILVPDIGDFSDVPIIEVLVTAGDEVAINDTVVIVESDKATLDIPTPHAGRVTAIKVAEGDMVSEGSLILMLEADSLVVALPTKEIATKSPETVAAPAVQKSAPAPPIARTPPSATEIEKPVYASPSVRRYARSLGVTIVDVIGSGPKGRVTREDIEAFVKARMTAPQPASNGQPIAGLPEWPRVDFAKFGPIERLPLSRIAKISGPALARNAMMIPHVTNFEKSDVTDLEEFRKTLNAEAGLEDVRITMLAFAVKAIVATLKVYPRFNSSLEAEELVIKQYWNIGIAADTPDGLVVPVVKDADKKGLREIADEMVRLAASAREGKLKVTDMQGATFTISSLGGIGGTNFTPIINAPEVAILGMTRTETQPVWDGTAFQPRLIQPLSLSWDHRVVDGVASARFLGHLAHSLSDFRRIAI